MDKFYKRNLVEKLFFSRIFSASNERILKKKELIEQVAGSATNNHAKRDFLATMRTVLKSSGVSVRELLRYI